MKLAACNFISFTESQADATTVKQQNAAIRAAIDPMPPFGSVVVENHPFRINQQHIETKGRKFALRRESKRTLIFRTR